MGAWSQSIGKLEQLCDTMVGHRVAEITKYHHKGTDEKGRTQGKNSKQKTIWNYVAYSHTQKWLIGAWSLLLPWKNGLPEMKLYSRFLTISHSWLEWTKGRKSKQKKCFIIYIYVGYSHKQNWSLLPPWKNGVPDVELRLRFLTISPKICEVFNITFGPITLWNDHNNFNISIHSNLAFMNGFYTIRHWMETKAGFIHK